MKKFVLLLMTASAAVAADQPKIAIVGLLHSHVWGHIGKMIKGEPARLVAIVETEPELIAEAKKRGATAPVYSDIGKMLDETKPDIVWSFVENNRHLEVVQACAPRKVHVMFEKPLASNYADAVKIRDLAKKHGIHVMTNYQMAWWASNYTAKSQTDSGAVGQVFRLRGVVGHGGPGGATGLNKYFFGWLTDPVKNGAGALMDFGCYNALWSLMYLGRPESVYATTNQLRPGEFPKVEDNSTMILKYKNAVGIFEGSWDLPRSFQDLEIFGRQGSLYVQNGKIELRKGRGQPEEVKINPLAPENAEPIAFMVNTIRTGKPIEGMVGLDLNLGVIEIIDAAKKSVATGQAVKLK
jgi:predicted dehydrogenase